MSAPEEHALLSASGAARWLACPPSARLEEGLPESASSYAEEGRLAHAIVELKIRKYFIEPMGPRKFSAQIKKLTESPLYQPEMLTHADTFLDYVQAVAHSFAGAKPYVASERRVDYSKYVPEGFGTCDCLLICDKVLHIFDYKYGQGVPVSAEDNPQMKLYALGAIEAYGLLFQFDTVVLHIVQPRLNSTSDFTLTVEALLDWAERIRPIALMAHEGKGDFVAGDHCRFCRAKAQCRARAKAQLQLTKYQQIHPALLADTEIGEALRIGQNLAKWLKNVEDYALSQCLAGKEIPGFKAVAGRSLRVWTDMDAAFHTLIDHGVDEALLYERKPLTLAAVEKLVGKKAFDETCREYVVTPPGKPTLAPATDKREAMTETPSVQEIFAN